MGMTMLAGAIDKAVVRQKWARRPAHPIKTNQGTVVADGSAMSPSYPAVASPKQNCITVNQNKMHVIFCVFVSLRVKIAVNANPIAAVAAASVPDEIGVAPGCVTIITPINPMTAANTPTVVIRSFNKRGDNIITQIGVVNSNAKT